MVKKKKTLVKYLLAVAAIACVAAIWILSGNESWKEKEGAEEEGHIKVHFLDVGQGDSILIQSEEENLLIDAGTNEDEDVVVSYLKDQGVERLDYVIATHPHIDHIGGMDAVIDAFPIGLFFLPEESYDTESFDAVLKELKRHDVRIRHPEFMENYEIGSGRFLFITPDSKQQYEDVNDSSLGIRLTNGVHSFLLCGDISKTMEKKILKSGLSVQSDVMKLNHHGSSDANSREFLKAVDPSFIVITCGTRNEFGHPHEKVMKRVKEIRAEVFRTDILGTVVVESDGLNLKWNKTPAEG